MSPHQYDAVVLYFRSPDTIAGTIRDVLAQDMPARRVLVVDNSSEDALEARLLTEGLLEQVELITLSTNAGYGGGMNDAARRLDGNSDRILFVTHEVRLAPDCVRHLSGALDDGASLAGPGLRLVSDRRAWSAGGRITRWGRARHDLDLDETTRPCDWLDGSVLMIDRATYDRLGGFEERYFVYWEDVDLGLRTNRLVPGSVVCVGAARAAQDTSMAAPRFDARNQVMMWRILGERRLSLIGLLTHVAKSARELARGERDRARARLHGVGEAARFFARSSSA